MQKQSINTGQFLELCQKNLDNLIEKETLKKELSEPERKAMEFLQKRGVKVADGTLTLIDIGIIEKKKLSNYVLNDKFVFNNIEALCKGDLIFVYFFYNKEGKICFFQFDDFLNRDTGENTKFNMSALQRELCFLNLYDNTKNTYIVEGFWDGVSILKAFDYEINVICLLGEPSKEIIKELKELKEETNLIIAVDNDKAGQRFRETLIKELKGLRLKEAIPEGEGVKDWNDLEVKAGIDEVKKQAEGQRVNNAFGNVAEIMLNVEAELEREKEGALPIPEKFDYLKKFFEQVEGLPYGIYAIAGKPASGKTSFLFSLCCELAKNNDIKSCYILTEEPRRRLIYRLKTCYVKGGNDKEKNKALYLYDWLKNLYIYEASGEITEKNLYDTAKEIKRDLGERCFLVLDSINALPVSNEKLNLQLREKIIIKIQELYKVARELEMQVFFTSFIPKGEYKSEGDIGIFKEAGEIDYLIDCGIVLSREDTKTQNIKLNIVKNRFGSTGDVNLIMKNFSFIPE